MIMKKDTKPSPFEGYTESVEKVLAFRFEDAHQINDVLDAFGAEHGTWTISSTAGSLTLSFPKPEVETAPAVLDNSSPINNVSNYIITLVPYYQDPHSGWIRVHEGDWIVRRYVGTDHPETVVMTDKDFSRKFR